MARVFLYNLPEGEKLRRIRTVLLRRGIAARAVTYPEYGHPLGYLSGWEGFAPGGVYTGPDFKEEMLVLEGFSPRELSALLDELRAFRAVVALKAVVTPTNAAWSSAALHDAILEEHNAMQQARQRSMQK